ncbi:MAG: hypothetical protein AAB271_09165, partial [Nitrospirota bacterium]
MSAHMAPLAITMALLIISGCGKSDQPSPSDSVAAPLAKTAPAPALSQPRIETAVVEFSPSHQALTLSGKVAYGE